MVHFDAFAPAVLRRPACRAASGWHLPCRSAHRAPPNAFFPLLPAACLQLIEKLKADGEVQQAQMEGLILQHKAEASARDSLVGETAAASRDSPAVRPIGPLQVGDRAGRSVAVAY